MVKATEELKNCVKGVGCNRYKFMCMVYLGLLQSQGMAITSHYLLNERFDRYSTACYRNLSLYGRMLWPRYMACFMSSFKLALYWTIRGRNVRF